MKNIVSHIWMTANLIKKVWGLGHNYTLGNLIDILGCITNYSQQYNNS